jgi:hypothetical protein
MLIRQTMGGEISKFDIHLMTTYLSYGFVLAFMALLPPLISLFQPMPRILWTFSSGLAVLLFVPVVASVVFRRRRASSHSAPVAVKASFFAHGFATIVLLVNAVFAPWQGVHLYAAALTFSLAIVIWMFVRRIASLFGDKLTKGYDPNRG